jgi:apolipoprotein N-acyltransferase
MPLRARLALAALSGVLYVVAFPGMDQWWLSVVAWVPALLALRGTTVRQAVVAGVVVGFVSHCFAYYWIVHLLQQFAMAPLPFAILGMLGLCIGQGASYGVGLGLARWLQLRTGWPWALTLAVGLTAMDFAYPLIFPSYVANDLHGWTWMMQGADLFGVLGLTALLGAINGAFADGLGARLAGRPLPRRTLGVVGALWMAALAYGAARTAQVDRLAAAAPKLKVGLVQQNVGGADNHLRPEEGQQRLVEATRRLSSEGVELVVWPEGAYRGYVRDSTDVRAQVLGGTPQPLLFGALRSGLDPRRKRVPFNSAFLAGADGRVLGYYDKIVLLAFGEYVPGADLFPQIYEWLPYSAHFGRGETTAPLRLGDWSLGTFICYEDIVPRLVQRIMAPVNGERPHAMVNITNDSWYGDTSEPPIHLALAAFRAVEHRRMLVRSTNTGISAFIDPAGRTVARTGTFTEETLVHDVPRMTGTTVYEELGDVAGWAALAVLSAVALRSRRRAAAAG